MKRELKIKKIIEICKGFIPASSWERFVKALEKELKSKEEKKKWKKK